MKFIQILTNIRRYAVCKNHNSCIDMSYAPKNFVSSRIFDKIMSAL